MELIQFGIIPLTNHPSFPDRKGRVIDNAAAQFIKDGFMTVNAGGKLCQEPIPIGGKQALKVRYGQKGGAQGGHIPSIGRPHFDSGKDALKVCDFFKGFTELCPQPGITYKRAYSLLPTCNAGRIIKGGFNPPPHEAGSHGGRGVIKDIKEGAFFRTVLHIPDQFQIADSRCVKDHGPVCRNFREAIQLRQIAFYIDMDILKHEFNRIPYKRFGIRFPFRPKMTGKSIDSPIFLEAVDHALGQFL